MHLFYATDFVDRLEKQIIPALRAGFVCLTDRYIYSIIARGLARGADLEWLHDVFGFAIVPDIVFYLKVDLEDLIPRVMAADGGFDYWESGMDYLPGSDLFENYELYQQQLLEQFDAISERYDFQTIDAWRDQLSVYVDLKTQIATIIADMKPARPRSRRRRR